MEATEVVVCAAGLKGLTFVEGILKRGLRPRSIISYEQSDDASHSYARLAELSCKSKLLFSEAKRPSFYSRDLVFCVGWQYLLSRERGNIVVFHDSLLPRYRGFAPTVNALINGDMSIGVTALRPTEGVDEGPIYAQASTEVKYPVKIVDALTIQANLMVDLAVEIFAAWQDGELTARNQNDANATYSLWRDTADYEIDWSHPATDIARFVDAVGYPYAGARTVLKNEVLRVEAATPINDVKFEIRQHGKVWRLDAGAPIVVCGSGLLRLDRCTDVNGASYPFRQLRSRLGRRT